MATAGQQLVHDAPPQKKRLKVLVADDDGMQRKLLSHLLLRHGYEVEAAADGAHAWEAIRRDSPNVVLTDWVMPGLSGLELTRRIRSTPFGQYTYIIVCTAKSSRADLIEALQAGADDFLAKPVREDELRVRLAAGERVIDLERRLAEDNRKLAEANARLANAYQVINEDLDAAAKLQRDLLPPPARICNLQFDSLFLPASGVAGDIFNYFRLSENEVGFYALDVSGHGIPAAMLSVTLSKILATRPVQNSPLVQMDSSGEGSSYKIRTPEQAISEINRRFQDQGDMYFTMAYGIIDCKRKILQWSQAGHPNPILLTNGNAPLPLGEGGFPVGVITDLTFDLLQHELKSGDRLFLSSDGILECTNRRGEQFGMLRMMDFIDKQRDHSLHDTMRLLEEALRAWTEGLPFADDLSLLAIEID